MLIFENLYIINIVKILDKLKILVILILIKFGMNYSINNIF